MTQAFGVAALATAVAACGAPASAAAAGPPHPGGQARSGGEATPIRACPASVGAGLKDNGRTLCVAPGGNLVLLLPQPSGMSWSSPDVTGRALGPARPLPTPYGTAGWSFPAISRGTGAISLTRPACPAAKPGNVTCFALLRYALRVKVRPGRPPAPARRA